jgi:hypothetical protein
MNRDLLKAGNFLMSSPTFNFPPHKKGLFSMELFIPLLTSNISILYIEISYNRKFIAAFIREAYSRKPINITCVIAIF